MAKEVKAGRRRKAIALIAFGMLAACSKASSDAATAFNVDENLTTTAINPSGDATPNYDDHEGDKYFYVAAVSQEDQKKGRAAGDVSTFRYLGETDGVYRLELLGDSGQRIGTAECKRRCRVTKTVWVDGTVSRGGYNSNSILGSAFEDAFNGYLTIAGTSKKLSEQPRTYPGTGTSIPAKFVGEWNENLSDCGTDNNDTRLRVEPTRLLFYESVARVKNVTFEDANTLAVSGSFSGEGETWTDTYRMRISPSGNELITGELTRKRCPQ